MNIISLFSGCGGLDLGFQQAGFNNIWANDYDKKVTDTFQYNFPNIQLDTRNIKDIALTDIPNNIDGIIGGPPNNSWRTIESYIHPNNCKKQLFLTYMQIINDKKPKFFLTQNVAILLSDKYWEDFKIILEGFKIAGYNVNYKLLNTSNYNIPQTRRRVIIVGYRNDLNKRYTFPPHVTPRPTLRDSIFDLKDTAIATSNENREVQPELTIDNHEYIIDEYSMMYEGYNRIKSWDEESFSVQAYGRKMPIHPSAPEMTKLGHNRFIFKEGHEVRCLSIRESARLQTFPDDFHFVYKNINQGYKVVGDAFACEFARILADVIYKDLSG